MSKQLSSKKLTDFFKPKPAAPTEAMTPQPPPQPASLRREDSGSSIALPSLPSSQTSTKPRVIPSSDGEESSSDDSDLEDPFKAYAPSRKASFPTPKPPRVKTKRTLSDSPNEKAKPKPAAPPTVYKFSLDQLLEDRAKAQAVEANIRRATELVASAEAPKNHSEQVHNVRSLFTKETAATIMGVNGGSGERLLAAMNREEDWKIEMTWEFFDHRKVNAIPRPFPIEATRDHAVFAVMGGLWPVFIMVDRG